MVSLPLCPLDAPTFLSSAAAKAKMENPAEQANKAGT